jgi:hypothetical protein
MRYIISSAVALVCASCCFAGPATQPAASLPTPPQGQIITQIVSRDKVIIVRAGANEPTYSLQTKSGEVLVPPTTAGDLAVSNPQLLQTIHTMQATTLDASVVDGE